MSHFLYYRLTCVHSDTPTFCFCYICKYKHILFLSVNATPLPHTVKRPGCMGATCILEKDTFAKIV